jgi:hypothetical protein
MTLALLLAILGVVIGTISSIGILRVARYNMEVDGYNARLIEEEERRALEQDEMFVWDRI